VEALGKASFKCELLKNNLRLLIIMNIFIKMNLITHRKTKPAESRIPRKRDPTVGRYCDSMTARDEFFKISPCTTDFWKLINASVPQNPLNSLTTHLSPLQ
jgi:hypothetical protein